MHPLRADPPYFSAVNQSIQVHILEIIICEPIESIKDPLPLLFVLAFQLALTNWTCFPGREKSCIPVSGWFARVKDLLSGIYFPPIVVKQIKALRGKMTQTLKNAVSSARKRLQFFLRVDLTMSGAGCFYFCTTLQF